MSKTAHTTRDDTGLCARAANGDRNARRALYIEHADGVMTVAMRILCDRAQAEDVVQDTFIRAFDKLGTFRGQSRFSTWLRRIAINQCLQRLRSPWHTRSEMFVEADAPENSTSDQIDLLRALATLDAVSRAVVWLHDVEGFKHREIAEAMGRTVSFSKSRLARAHRALRDALDPPADSPLPGEPATQGDRSTGSPPTQREIMTCAPILKTS
ncbi:MAG: sigma-70 family RNA polymerase sigma factor [Pseudomonadota bacterium]